MAVPRTRVKMRERAINVRQKLIIRPTPDLGKDEDDDETDEHGLRDLKAKEAEKQAKENALKKSQSTDSIKQEKDDGVKKAVIPAPPCFDNQDYETEDQYIPWKSSHPFIKFFINSGSGINTSYDYYDLRHDDVVWLQKYNQMSKLPPVSEKEMEALIDMFEKESAFKTKAIDPVNEFGVLTATTLAREKLQLTDKSVEHIYEYWRARRKLVKKALMRRFQIPPVVPGPHVAFVTRQIGRRISSRNPRKNDVSAYRKMRHLRNDFERVLSMIQLLKKREQIKRHRVMVQAQEFDEALKTTALGQKLVGEVAEVSTKRTQAKAVLGEKLKKAAEDKAKQPAHELPSAGPQSQWTYPLFKEETEGFPGYYLGPLPYEHECWKVEQQQVDSKLSVEQNLAELMLSNLPISDYIGMDQQAELEKRAKRKLTQATKRKRSDKRSTARQAARMRAKLGEAAAALAGEMEVEDSSSDDSEFLSENTDDEEYFREVERYLDRVGRHTHSLAGLPALSFPMSAVNTEPNKASMAYDPQLLNGSCSPSHSRSPTRSPVSSVVGTPKEPQLVKMEDDEDGTAPMVAMGSSSSSSSSSVSPGKSGSKRGVWDVEAQVDAQFTGYFRGRVGRGGRMYLDVSWKDPADAQDSMHSSDDDAELTDEPDLSLIDEQFFMKDGVVVGKQESPLPYLYGPESYTLPL